MPARPFRAIEDAQERGILTTALQEYSTENGIDPAGDEYEES
jgi:hypothetical protein